MDRVLTRKRLMIPLSQSKHKALGKVFSPHLYGDQDVFHCVTRLRIVPVNRDLVDLDKLNSVKGLLKVIESSGQLQCVVETTVAEVYGDFLEVSGFKAGGEAAPETSDSSSKEKKPNLITQGLNTLASCVTPGLYAIVAGGMIKGIISLITAIGLVSSKSDIPC